MYGIWHSSTKAISVKVVCTNYFNIKCYFPNPQFTTDETCPSSETSVTRTILENCIFWMTMTTTVSPMSKFSYSPVKCIHEQNVSGFDYWPIVIFSKTTSHKGDLSNWSTFGPSTLESFLSPHYLSQSFPVYIHCTQSRRGIWRTKGTGLNNWLQYVNVPDHVEYCKFYQVDWYDVHLVICKFSNYGSWEISDS